ncbi:DMT family transporter (plasmid) [Photobacterium sp. DA100]|uniref:DMT family transporter n=1 Tax=Photobacterium sp. DA100 TaxID=3027472 RepID=UPI00247A3B26|nr:DMT family transporter [Photobacterium sp. DA100]WEM45261.1 DMT family transporter [Photobacterium sp. DA100]
MRTKYIVPMLFLSVCLIWGTTWFAMEVAVTTIPPIMATGLRFLIAAPLLVALAKYFEQPLLFPKGRGYWVPIVAVFYFALPFTLMIFGEQYISSGLAAIIFANMPIVVMLASFVFLRLRLVPHQLLGLLLAAISLSWILVNEMAIGGTSYAIGIGALSGAVIIHAVMYVMVQKHCKDIPVLTYNALPCLLASVLLLFVSGLVESVDMSGFAISSLAAVVFLGVVASVGGIVAYFKLNQVSTPFTASLCFFIFPIVALLISAAVNNSGIGLQSMLLLAPLFMGILLSKAEPALWRKGWRKLTVRPVKKCPACLAEELV